VDQISHWCSEGLSSNLSVETDYPEIFLFYCLTPDVLEPYLKIDFGHFHILWMSSVTIIVANIMCWAVKNVIIQVAQSQLTHFRMHFCPVMGGRVCMLWKRWWYAISKPFQQQWFGGVC